MSLKYKLQLVFSLIVRNCFRLSKTSTVSVISQFPKDLIEGKLLINNVLNELTNCIVVGFILRTPWLLIAPNVHSSGSWLIFLSDKNLKFEFSLSQIYLNNRNVIAQFLTHGGVLNFPSLDTNVIELKTFIASVQNST